MTSLALTACWLASSAAALSLTIGLIQTPATPAVGTPITYLMVVTNTGAENITTFQITDTISPILIDTNIAPSNPFIDFAYLQTDSTATYLHWTDNNMTLSPGGWFTMTITGTVGPTGISGTIIDTASITASGPSTSTSLISNPVSFFADASVIPPSVPGPVTDPDLTDAQITLEWTPATGGTSPVSGYEIWGATTVTSPSWEDFAQLATVSTTTFNGSGTFGYYKVRAIDTAGLVGPFTAVMTDFLTPTLSFAHWFEPPGYAGDGDVVKYQLSFSNTGSYSAFAVMLTAHDFTNRSAANLAGSAVWVSGGDGSVTPGWAKSLAGPWFFGVTVTGQTEPLYLRWILGHVGMHKSGYVRYAAQVQSAPCSLLPSYASATMTSGLPDFVPYEVPYTATAYTYCKVTKPTPLTAFPQGPDIGLNWGSSSAGYNPLSAYEIWRSSCPACTFSYLATEPDTVTSYLDANVATGNLYDYRVRGVDWLGIPGAFSLTVTAAASLSPYLAETADQTTVQPADYVQYTITYAAPALDGTGNLVIFETLPPYTHFLAGWGSLAPDTGWDPDPGPPQHLRWTIPGPSPSGSLTYDLSVDWGNGEAFEPGSGDVAAPQGTILSSRPSMDWDGGTPGSLAGPGPDIPVEWFNLTKTGTGTPGEVLYTLSLRHNASSNSLNYNSWWDVTLWDTVPTGLDVWGPGYGFEDSCFGTFTMTPTGSCDLPTMSFATVGGRTILRWNYGGLNWGDDLFVQWKGRLDPSILSATVIDNTAAIRSAGRTGVVSGTGNSGAPATASTSTILAPTVPPSAPAIMFGNTQPAFPAMVTIVWFGATPGSFPISGYEIYRATFPGGPATLAGTTDATTHYIQDATVTNGLTYEYRIHAIDLNGMAGPDLVVAAPVLPPTVISLVKDVTPLNPQPGAAATYRIIFQNLGTVTLTAVSVTDSLPAAFQVATVDQPASVSLLSAFPGGDGSTSYRWSSNVGIAPGAGFTITVTGTVAVSATGTVCNEVSVFASESYTTGSVFADSSTLADSQACFTMSITGSTPPGAPATLSANSAPSAVTLSWTPATPGTYPVSAYEIWRATCGACPSALYATTAGVSFSDTGLTAGFTYAYQVRAVDTTLVTGPFSPSASAAAFIGPSAPASLTALGDATNAIVHLAWSPAAAGTYPVSGYEVWRATCPACPGTWLVTLPATVTSYNDPTVAVVTTYFFTVRAFDVNGFMGPFTPDAIASAPTNIDPPPAPLALTGMPGPSSITVSWISGGACGCALQGYEIWRATCSLCAPSLLTVVGPSATAYTDPLLAGGITYVYAVRAVNTGGIPGAFSASTATAPGTGNPPPAPATPSVTPGPASVTVMWPASGPCGCLLDHYEIWRSTCNGCPSALWGAVNASASIFSDRYLTGGATYWYAVRAVNTDGIPGGFSPAAGSAAGPADPPPAPASLGVTAGPSSILLTWPGTGPCGCLLGHYEIWRTTCSGCPQTLSTVVDASATYYLDQYLVGGITYGYEIRGINTDGTAGGFSPGASGVPGPGDPPPAPLSLTATPGPQQVTLNWDPAFPCGCVISTYEIWRATCGGCPKTLFIVVGPSVTIYIDRYLTSGVTYEYAVRAVNTDGSTGSFSATGGAVAGAGAVALSLDKYVTPASPVPGSPASYHLTITNIGSEVIDALTLVDTVPTAITNITTAQPAGFAPPVISPTASGTLYVWSATGLGFAPGASLSFTVTGIVGILPGPSGISNTACTHAANGPDAGTASSPVSFFTATPTASLVCTASVSATLFAVGSWYTVTLTVTCNGTTHCTNVSPACTFSGACTLIAAPSVVPTLLAGEIRVFTWTFSCSGTGPITFTTSCTGTEGWSGRTFAVLPVNGSLPPVSASLQARPSCTLTLVSGHCHRGHACHLRCHVINLGGYACDASSATLYIAGSTFIVTNLIGPVPPGPLRIDPASATDFDWTFTPSGDGDLTFTVSVTADGADGVPVQGVGNLSIAVTEPAAFTLTKQQIGGGTVGAPLTYRIILDNIGGVTFTDVTVTDTVSPVAVMTAADQPAGFGAPTLTQVAGSGTLYAWSATGLAVQPGTSLTFTITGSVGAVCTATAVSNTAWAAAADVADADGAAAALSNPVGFMVAAPTVSFTLATTQTPASPGLGDPIQYQLVVTNTGTAPLDTLTVTDTISPVVRVTGTTQPGFGAPVVTVSPSGTRFVWSGSGLNLAPAGILTITVNGTVGAVCVPTAVTDTAFADGGSACTQNRALSNAVGMTVQPATIGLSLADTQAPASPAAGAPVTYTLVLTNTGAATLAGITVTDTLSSVITAVTPATPAGFGPPAVTSVASGTRYVWTSTTPLLPGAVATFVLAGTAGDSCVQATVGNTVYAAGAAACAAVSAQGVASAFTLSGPTLAYTAQVLQIPAAPVAGGPVTYRLIVTNTGTALISDVTVVDTVAALVGGQATAQPAGFAAPAAASVSGGVRYVWSATGLTVAPGTSLTFTITGTVTAVSADTMLANGAEVAAGNGCAVLPAATNIAAAALKAPVAAPEPVDVGKVKIVGGVRGYINPKHGEQATILIRPTAAGQITVRIYDQDGVLIWQMTESTSGGHTDVVQWRGVDQAGNQVPPGLYPIFIEAPGIRYRDTLVVIH